MEGGLVECFRSTSVSMQVTTNLYAIGNWLGFGSRPAVLASGVAQKNWRNVMALFWRIDLRKLLELFVWVKWGAKEELTVRLEQVTFVNYLCLSFFLQLLAKHLLQSFEWELVPGQDLTYKWLPVSRPKNDVQVVFRKIGLWDGRVWGYLNFHFLNFVFTFLQKSRSLKLIFKMFSVLSAEVFFFF